MEKTKQFKDSLLFKVLMAIANFNMKLLHSRKVIPSAKTPGLPVKYIRGFATTKKICDVRVNRLAYHKEQGWVKVGHLYKGYYRCRWAAFKGEIKEMATGEHKYFIYNPPMQVLTGPHKACFTDIGNGRYHIHFALISENIDAGIMAVERLLTESLSRG